MAALSMLLFAIFIGIACLGLVAGLFWGFRFLWRLPPSRRYVISCAAAIIVVISIDAVVLTLGNYQESRLTGGAVPSPQDLLQQKLSADEKALDKGILTYPVISALPANDPFMLTATVTDVGKNPRGFMTPGTFSEESGLVAYDHNVPIGGILNLSLTCPSTLYCQAIGAARQAVVGTGSSGTWSWSITPLRQGATSAVIAAMTYDGTSNVVLAEEDIPLPKTETGTETKAPSQVSGWPSADRMTRGQGGPSTSRFTVTFTSLTTQIRRTC
jgi:hypothetical protein